MFEAMEIEFAPRRSGWIDLLVGPEIDSRMEISLSNVMDPFADLHKFFFCVVTDRTGFSQARIDEEGPIVVLKAAPAKNPSHAKISLTRRSEELASPSPPERTSWLSAGAITDAETHRPKFGPVASR